MADVKIAYGASAALTITLTSLASDTNLIAGRESTAISNASNLYDDILIGGKVTTGTTPTTLRQIDIWGYATVNDTPLYPDAITGTDGNRTMTTADIRNASLRLLASLRTDATSDRSYWMAPVSLAAVFGGVLPRNWGIWIVHNTGANLNATGSNQALYYTPVYYTVT